MDVKKLSLEDRAKMCNGVGRWYTQAVEGLDSIMVSDGPHGLRKENRDEEKGTVERVKATCFPSAAGLACSWNEELIGEVGKTLAKETKAEQVSVLLGPGVNMKRSPLCGRNFEYFSEDPYLAGKLATSYVNGVQGEGVGTSLKHFAVNSQETRRFTIDEVVSERALREIYLPAFEMVVKESQPKTIMASYNKINGVHACENKWLLTDLLRKEWGFKGLVTSDWNAVTDIAKALEAVCDITMPSTKGEFPKRIVQMVKEGTLDEKYVNESAQRVADLAEWGLANIDKNATYDRDEDHAVAANIARECMVLLKNEGMLPLKKGESVAIIGGFARKPRFQGGGSSHVTATKVDDIFENFEQIGGGELVYAQGYPEESDIADDALIAEAVAAAKKCGKAIVFAGLPDSYETESRDRRHMRMPEAHCKLIEEVAKACPDTAVVLSAGSPVEMPWIGSVNAILHAYLGGQALGKAIAEIVYGDVNPSGKLAETHPVKLEDNPTFGFYPGDLERSIHAEDIYIGYRWYEKKKIPVNFPFGFGLSYTKYEYESISLDKTEMTDEDTLTVTVKVKNVGERDGKEVVELYTAAPENAVELRPVKELKGFKKVFIKAGESAEVNFTLSKRAFAFWDVTEHAWRVPTGKYKILVGSSSVDVPLVAEVNIEEKNPPCHPITLETTFGKLTKNSSYKDVVEDVVGAFTPQDAIGILTSEEGKADPVFSPYQNHTPRRALYTGRTYEYIEDVIEKANKKLGY